MAVSSATPKWRRRRDARPGEITRAAYEVFAEKGFASARLDEIAARAGISKGALYLYFENKQDIFEAVVRDAVVPNIGAMQEIAASFRGSFAELVRILITNLARMAVTSPMGGVVKMVIGESGNFPELARVWHDDVIAKGLGLLTSLIEKAQAGGEVRAGDARTHALSLMSPLLVGVIFRETFVPAGAKPFDIEAVMQQHLDTVLPGLLGPNHKPDHKT